MSPTGVSWQVSSQTVSRIFPELRPTTPKMESGRCPWCLVQPACSLDGGADYRHQKWQRIRPNTNMDNGAKWQRIRPNTNMDNGARHWIKWCQNGSAFVRILIWIMVPGIGLNGARHWIKWCQASSSSSFRTLRKKFCKMQKKIAIFAQPNRYLVQPSVIIRNYFLLFH